MLVFAVEFFGSLLLDKYPGGYTKAIMTGRMIVCLVLRRDVCSHRSFQEDITMKFVKKMLAILVACAMAMTLLTACGGASNGKGNPMLDAVNEIFKACNSSIVLEQDAELDHVTEKIADLIEDKDAGKISSTECGEKMNALFNQLGENYEMFQIPFTTEEDCAAKLARTIMDTNKDFSEAAITTVERANGDFVLVICR